MTVFPKIVIRSAFQNKMAIEDAPKRVREDASISKASLAPRIINDRDRKPERAQRACASVCPGCSVCSACHSVRHATTATKQ